MASRRPLVRASGGNRQLPSGDTLDASVTGNAATATKLATARTLSWTGDVAGSTTYDGSGNSSAALTLASSGVTAGTYSGLTINAKGLISAAGNYGLGNTTAPTVTDASTISGTGMYRALFSASNIPIGTSGVLFHHSYDASSYTQLFAPTASATARLFVLNKFGSSGTRTPWREVAMLDSPSFSGSVTSAGPIKPGQYTLATLPSASAWNGYEIDVTDATGGAKRCRSNGTAWQILNTTTTVS